MATPIVTFEQAQIAVNAEVQKRNRKIVEEVPNLMKKIADDYSIYIFNVSPTPWSRNLGSLGNFHVPGCEEGEKVSKPLKIGGLVFERIATDMDKMGNRQEEGMDVARDVLFIGRGYAPELNREQYGQFISETETPSAKQIRDAHEKLRMTQQKHVAAADVLESQNKRDQITELHRSAARALGVTKAWLSEAPREAGNCPSCQKLVDVEAIKCGNCAAVLDWERAKEYFPELYLAHQKATAAK